MWQCHLCRITSCEYTDAVFLLYLPVLLNCRSNIHPSSKRLTWLGLVLEGKIMFFQVWNYFTLTGCFFPPRECYLILNVRRFYLKIFPHPVALYVWGTDGTKACDGTGKIGLCKGGACPPGWEVTGVLTSNYQLLPTVIIHKTGLILHFRWIMNQWNP